MKRILHTLAIGLLSMISLAQTPTYNWAAKGGGTNYDEGKKLVVDTAGNTYVFGEVRR
jgi:hypothetical protein